MKIVLLFLILVPLNSLANDDYYRALELEAQSLEVDSVNSNKSDKENEIKNKLPYPGIKYTITLQQFQSLERDLKEKFPKSFKSYSGLSEVKKYEIAHAYVTNSNSVLAAIQQLYKIELGK